MMQEKRNEVTSILLDCNTLRKYLHTMIYTIPDKLEELSDGIKEIPCIISVATTGRTQIQFEYDREMVPVDQRENMVMFMTNSISTVFKKFLENIKKEDLFSSDICGLIDRMVYGDLYPGFIFEIMVIGETVYITL